MITRADLKLKIDEILNKVKTFKGRKAVIIFLTILAGLYCVFQFQKENTNIQSRKTDTKTTLVTPTRHEVSFTVNGYFEKRRLSVPVISVPGDSVFLAHIDSRALIAFQAEIAEKGDGVEPEEDKELVFVPLIDLFRFKRNTDSKWYRLDHTKPTLVNMEDATCLLFTVAWPSKKSQYLQGKGNLKAISVFADPVSGLMPGPISIAFNKVLPGDFPKLEFARPLSAPGIVESFLSKHLEQKQLPSNLDQIQKERVKTFFQMLDSKVDELTETYHSIVPEIKIPNKTVEQKNKIPDKTDTRGVKSWKLYLL